MKDKITFEIHEVAIKLKLAGFSQTLIGNLLGVHRSALSLDLSGARKTPYRPSPKAAIPILRQALERLQKDNAA